MPMHAENNVLRLIIVSFANTLCWHTNCETARQSCMCYYRGFQTNYYYCGTKLMRASREEVLLDRDVILKNV